MILTILVLINICIFLCLSLIHLYWFFDGSLWIKHAIPERFYDSYFDIKNETKVKVATLIVALGLLVFALVIASNLFVQIHFISKESIKIITRIIAGVFMLRAIGDFNIVGLFRKDNSSLFAIKDRQLYIPLCLYLSISCALITIL